MAPGAEDRSQIRRVLFACTFNTTRSPMAAGLLRHFHKGAIEAASIGVHRSERVDPRAVEVMAEIGIDISRHRPVTLTDLESWGEDPADCDLIVALSPAAQRHALELTRYSTVAVEYWPAPDATQPTKGEDEEPLAAYRALREDLTERLKARFGAPRGVTV